MRKIYLVIIVFLIYSLPVKANSAYQVIDHIIDAEIEIAGGLRVREMILVEGSTNSFSRTINYKMLDEVWDGKTINFKSSPIYNGYSLENIKVTAFNAPATIDFDTFSLAKDFFSELDLKAKQDKTYTYTKNNLGATYNIHLNQENKKYIYYIEYLVSNVVVVHNDLMEINYTFKKLDIGAKNTLIRVVIPYATKDALYQFWVHGPKGTKLNELVSPNRERAGFLIEATDLKTDINFRITLPKEQVGIAIYLNKSNVDGLKAIQKAEEAREKESNFLINSVKIARYTITTLSVIYLLAAFLLLKYKQLTTFIGYLILGLFIMLFNYLLKFNYIYIYLIILVPIIIRYVGQKRT